MVQKAMLPEAVYPCADPDCATEVSFPPDMLYWWAGSAGLAAGFYCQEVWEDSDDSRGPSLAEEMDRRLVYGYHKE